MHLPRLLVPVAIVLALAGCAGPQIAAVPAGSSSASSSAAPTQAATEAAADVCALVPAAELKAAIRADPGTGVATKGRVDGGQCTWKISDTHTALAQFTRRPDAYLPASVWKPSKTAAAVPGATRGFADAAKHSILVVKDGKGLLFTDIAFQKADQSAYDALAKAIAAKL